MKKVSTSTVYYMVAVIWLAAGLGCFALGAAVSMTAVSLGLAVLNLCIAMAMDKDAQLENLDAALD